MHSLRSTTLRNDSMRSVDTRRGSCRTSARSSGGGSQQSLSLMPGQHGALPACCVVEAIPHGVVQLPLPRQRYCRLQLRPTRGASVAGPLCRLTKQSHPMRKRYHVVFRHDSRAVVDALVVEAVAGATRRHRSDNSNNSTVRSSQTRRTCLGAMLAHDNNRSDVAHTTLQGWPPRSIFRAARAPVHWRLAAGARGGLRQHRQ
jgi:hypothetical protein